MKSGDLQSLLKFVQVGVRRRPHRRNDIVDVQVSWIVALFIVILHISRRDVNKCLKILDILCQRQRPQRPKCVVVQNHFEFVEEADRRGAVEDYVDVVAECLPILEAQVDVIG